MKILRETTQLLTIKYYTFILILAATLISGTLRAQVPPLVNYQGRVAVDAMNFGDADQFNSSLNL